MHMHMPYTESVTLEHGLSHIRVFYRAPLVHAAYENSACMLESELRLAHTPVLPCLP